MSPEMFLTLAFLASLAGGLLGSLTGLGGGVVIIPILVLLMGVDMRYAVGASLIAVIATSSGAAAAFVREGFTNVRLAMLLEVATVGGAIAGALLAASVPVPALSVILGVVMLWTAWQSRGAPKPVAANVPPDALATKLRLDSTYPSRGEDGTTASTPYHVRNVPGGFGLMVLAGMLSALVGVGGGILKVLAMDRVMRVPFKVSTTTSNFMIGVTAAASAGVYLHRGQIEPTIATPVALGALAGSLIGARLLPRMQTKVLRLVFAVVVAIAGVQMILKGVKM
ncbi:MAG TPA: sulfite exporter TauE/SafE family protein [Phycisphaerales bacterium]|nr:sulfite exporter TauE/SafE family protein [Phycisphaerales bacterium]